jgi:quercetin dioxygenase-like cupin family protein
MATVKFFTPEDMGHRNFGKEILIAHIPGICTGKMLLMKAGTRGGLQYHRVKNESQYLHYGKMLIEYDTGDGKLTKKEIVAGQAWHIPPGAVHRETAITDCIIFEASNPVFNDRVRAEDQYGEKIDGGLPSTTIDEIEIR